MMAYMNFAEVGGAAALHAQFAPAATVAEEVADFDAREWSVIRLARNDSLSSIREESRFGRAVRFIFGIERRNPLANSRLEALRRMAVMSWRYGYNVASSEIGAFLAAGFSSTHYEELLKHIGMARAASGRRTRL